MSLSNEPFQIVVQMRGALTRGPQQRHAMHALRLVSGPTYLTVPHVPPGGHLPIKTNV